MLSQLHGSPAGEADTALGQLVDHRHGKRLEESAADAAAVAASMSALAGIGTFGLAAYRTFVDRGHEDEMDELRAQVDAELAEMRAQQAAEIAELRRQMGWGFGPEDDYSGWY